ncbi:MAG: radical SAM family heme chaperone HemW [Oscillospiraceae bacterium]|jgi:oxygen-independent coproporphyrinogen-3 oxidase|nr:radical SAM family heme chaperone HemW [Oscillospiraceae bacterium]
MGKNTALYVHVPFCDTKCIYCNFYSVKHKKITTDLYKSAVIRNVQKYAADERVMFDTVYFGGGTPSLLWREIAEITAFLRVNGALSANAEISVEANPSDINAEMLETLLKSGVNRISIGAQSLNDDELRFLGRRHDSKTAVKAVELTREAGFKNISVDIILGLPGQRDASAVYELPVNHISAYILKVEENTPLARINPAIDEDLTAELYLKTVNILGKNGFPQYEISNFAALGFECGHNLAYWRCGEYIGIGPAAHSYRDGKRFAVPEDAAAFIAAPLQETYITEEEPGTFKEWAMLKLRLSEGITFAECEARGVRREVILKRAVSIPRGYLNISDGGVALTAEGFLASNSVIGGLIG